MCASCVGAGGNAIIGVKFATTTGDGCEMFVHVIAYGTAYRVRIGKVDDFVRDKK